MGLGLSEGSSYTRALQQIKTSLDIQIALASITQGIADGSTLPRGSAGSKQPGCQSRHASSLLGDMGVGYVTLFDHRL